MNPKLNKKIIKFTKWHEESLREFFWNAASPTKQNIKPQAFLIPSYQTAHFFFADCIEPQNKRCENYFVLLNWVLWQDICHVQSITHLEKIGGKVHVFYLFLGLRKCTFGLFWLIYTHFFTRINFGGFTCRSYTWATRARRIGGLQINLNHLGIFNARQNLDTRAFLLFAFI